MAKRSSDTRKPKTAERALQDNEESYGRDASDGGTGQEEPSPPPSAIGDVQPGHHLCCIYETDEEHRAVVVPFLRHGLEGGEKVLYILDARDLGTILDYLREDRLDPDPYLERGQLSVVTAQDVYLKDGVFDPDAMIALLRAETDQALAEGYAALRVTGEMSWALRGLPGSERLIEYETKLNRFFPGSKCLAICQYDRRAFSAPLLLDVLTTHPIAVIGTTVHDNPYYVPAADLLGPDPLAARLRVWVKRLSERKWLNEVLQEASAELQLGAKSPSISTRDITVPDEVVRKWQSVVNAMAELIQVPAALIMKVEPPHIDVFSSSESSGNPFKAGARYDLAGVYCQKVIQTKRGLLVPNALKDKEWDSNPDLEYGMISYLGFPLVWPDGQVFGTICVSDTKENRYGEQYERLILQFKELAEFHLDQLYRSRQLEEVIAQREHSEETVRQSEENMRALLNASIDSALFCEFDGTVVDLNEAAAVRLGTTAEELKGKNIFDRFPPDVAAARKAAADAYLAAGKSVRFEDEREGMWFDVSLHPVFDSQGNPARVAIFASDITERKRAEEDLRKSEEDFRALFEASPIGAISVDSDGRIMLMNGAAEEMFGYERGELVGRPIETMIPKRLRSAHASYRARWVSQPVSRPMGGGPDLVARRKDGTEFPVEVGLSPVEGSSGTQAIALIADISVRLKAEEELRESETRIRSLLEASPDLMFTIGRDGTFLDFIPAEGQDSLLPSGEFLGKTVPEVMPTELAPRMMDLIEATLESGGMQSMEYELDMSDGRFQYECRIVLAGEDRVLAIVRDVTAQKLLAQQEGRQRARDELEGKVERDMLGRNPYGLTFREFSVLHLVARGEADKEVADHLRISPFTVNKHVANILAKMNASSRTEASVRAHKEGLIS